MDDKELWILIALFGGIFGFALIVKFAMWLNDFSGELKYLNSEIGRTDGSEQRYWKRQKSACGSPSYRLSDTETMDEWR